jgi:hypothetical protein
LGRGDGGRADECGHDGGDGDDGPTDPRTRESHVGLLSLGDGHRTLWRPQGALDSIK